LGVVSEDESFVPSDGKMASLSIAVNAEDVTGELGAEGDGSYSFQNHVGKRVAKLSDGDIINRGTVVQGENILGKSHFLILYDDLDTERVAPNGLPGKSNLDKLSDGLEMTDLTTFSLILVPTTTTQVC
jgi:hypothetical protein